MVEDLNNKQVGDIGEFYTMFRLSQLGISTVKLDPLFDYDMLTSNGKRIEVKTSKINIEGPGKESKPDYQREFWAFFNSGEQKDCDFFCLVGLDEDNNVEKIFVVPEKIIKNKTLIHIPRNSKREYHWSMDYEDKFELVVKEQQVGIDL